MFNASPHCPEGSPRRPSPTRPLPEVADLPPGAETGQLPEVATFKVFLKRNLRPQAPPAELLGDIRARIAKIRAEK